MELRGAHIAVTGGSGRLGQFLCAYLDAQGCTVRHLRDHLPAGLAAQDFAPFLEGCDGLVHAAFYHVPGKYRGGEGTDPEAFWAINHGGTERLLRQAKALGVKKIILFSSRAVYGSNQTLPDGPITEDFIAEPDTLYGKLKQASELLAQNLSDETCAITALRATGIYGGPPHLNKWKPLIEAAERGCLPSTNPIKSEVSGKTVAEAMGLAFSAEGSAFSGQTLNLSEVKISPQEILDHLGFETRSMPTAEAFRGAELSSAKAQSLGLTLRGRDDLLRSAVELRDALKLGGVPS